MPATSTVEQLLVQWATWSRHEVGIGPTDAGCGSAESSYRSPQHWDPPGPRVVICSDEVAMHVERCVIGTGVVLAAALRSFYIRLHPPRTHAQVQLLLEAQRRVGMLLAAPQEARNRPRRDAGDGRAMSGSAERL